MIPPFEEHGTGRPIVLIHAFPLSRSMWAGNINTVTSAGFRMILPDLRGFGENESFADINTMEDMAKDIGELLDKLKIEHAIIGGLSMGGYVTFALYRLFPEKFAAIMLFDTTSAADTEEKRQNRFDIIEKIESDGPQALADSFLPNLTGDLTKADNPELVRDLKQRINAANPKAAVAALRGMAERPDSTSLLSEIDIPACLIFGEDDKITSIEGAAKMKEAIRGSELTVIKNSGHLSNMEQPDQFNSVLVDFIKRVQY